VGIVVGVIDVWPTVVGVIVGVVMVMGVSVPGVIADVLTPAAVEVVVPVVVL
jgi:hypothetical protein